MNNDLGLLQTFLPALVEKHRALELTLLETKKNQITLLFNQLFPLQQRLIEYEEMHASNFNVFEVLRYGNYETRLHTPFLFSLLQPKGVHLLGHRFLDLFIENIFESPISYSEMRQFQIIEELNTKEFGQIDIFISFYWNQQQYCIAVENKINAIDQDKQLERYYNYMSQAYPQATKRLIYLSKSGKYPSTKSLNNTLLNQYLAADILHLRSYKSDVIRWIDQLLLKETPKVVKFTLRQYKQTINAFEHD